MKKSTLLVTLLALSSTACYAGSGAFFAGMGTGAAMTFVGSKIGHSCSRPRYVEVQTVRHDESFSLRQELRALERENDQLTLENNALRSELNDEFAIHRQKQRKAQQQINALEQQVNELAKKLETFKEKEKTASEKKQHSDKEEIVK